ncbi:hypothetical protein HZF02_16125 [Pseudomonas yamanorum]|nr:hypothetical protein HZF02_16125 [Pseudomonas yamanorum]
MTDVIFFSPSTCGAYWPVINDQDIPADVIELPLAQWQALLAELAVSPKKLVAGADGLPILIDPPPPSTIELEANERAWRGALLAKTDAIVTRHRDELEEGSETTLSAAQYSELQAYRRSLRNWPEAGELPLIEHRPVAPTWLVKYV